MARLALALLVVVLAAGCGGGRDDPFAYDSSQPLDVRTAARAAIGRVGIEDISFAGPADRVPAFLAHPAGSGRRPAVVLLHGATGTRDQFLAEAVALARSGAVALTLTSAFERSPDPLVRANREPVSTDRRLFVRSVVDVRRALDLLRARPDVDPDRLALVGYSRGAVWAALAAAVEDVDAVVLMGPPSNMSQRVLPAADRGLVADLDTVRWVGRAAPAELLVQGGRFDATVPPAETRKVFAAAHDPKRLRWYPTGHSFGVRTYDDRLAFLRRVLRLG